MKKILHVICGMGTGGAEKDIINWYRNIDNKEYQFDFLIRSNETFYKQEILEKGGQVFHTANFPQKIIKNFLETKRFFEENHSNYDVVHVHGNTLLYILPLILAKRYSIPVRIMHTHNTKSRGKISYLIHAFNKFFVTKYANVLLACSQEAGEFAYNHKKFTVINNAMDLSKFFTKKDMVLKSNLNIADDSIVISHIGRFLPAKNHLFLIDVFAKILKKEPKAILLLIGSGPLRAEIEDKVRIMNLDKHVKFLGERTDVEKILSFTDIVVFPSIYEGVPLVVLEAQASGTKVIYSDTVDKQVQITPYVKSKSLNEDKEEWANAVIDFIQEKIECDIEDCFSKAGYTIESVVEIIKEIYEGGSGVCNE